MVSITIALVLSLPPLPLTHHVPTKVVHDDLENVRTADKLSDSTADRYRYFWFGEGI